MCCADRGPADADAAWYERCFRSIEATGEPGDDGVGSCGGGDGGGFGRFGSGRRLNLRLWAMRSARSRCSRTVGHAERQVALLADWHWQGHRGRGR
jgi:hypothetical protein